MLEEKMLACTHRHDQWWPHRPDFIPPCHRIDRIMTRHFFLINIWQGTVRMTSWCHAPAESKCTHRQLAPHSLTGWQTGKQDKWLNSVQVHVKLLAGLGWAGLGNTSAKLAKVGPVCPDSLQLLTSTEKVDIFLVDKSLHTFTENWKIVRHIAPQDSCCWDGGLTAWHHTPPAQSYTSLRRDQPPR